MTFIENFLEKYDHNTNIKIIKNFKHRNSLRKGGTPPPLSEHPEHHSRSYNLGHEPQFCY